MNAAARGLAWLALWTTLAWSEGVCPKPVDDQSGADTEISWASGMQRIGAEKICMRQQVSNLNDAAPLPIVWPAAGILAAAISGPFERSFCCAEGQELQKEDLKYGASSKVLNTTVHTGTTDTNDDYPDLIEGDARTKRTAFAGKLWDGSRYVTVNVELRASASHPHFNQSVFQFVIIDQSSEALSFEWNLVEKLIKTIQPYVTGSPEGGGHRQTTYVFFGKEQPAPAGGVVEIKTSSGTLLGRFDADGFINKK
jgi:hypothetical protein